MKRVTIATLRAAAPQGATITDDRDDATLRAEAPAFHIWTSSDVHELVASYGSWGSYLPEWRTDALKDLLERMQQGVERCTDDPCDWCDENRETIS